MWAENWGLYPFLGRWAGSPSNTKLPGLRPTSIPSAILVKKVKVGFLYSATYTRNGNSALYNLGSGGWLARASGAAVRMRPSAACTNGHWTRGSSYSNHTTTPINHTKPSPRKRSSDVTTSTKIADTPLLLTAHLSTSKGWKAKYPEYPNGWCILPFGNNKNGPKIGGLCPFFGEGSWLPI